MKLMWGLISSQHRSQMRVNGQMPQKSWLKNWRRAWGCMIKRIVIRILKMQSRRLVHMMRQVYWRRCCRAARTGKVVMWFLQRKLCQVLQSTKMMIEVLKLIMSKRKDAGDGHQRRNKMKVLMLIMSNVQRVRFNLSLGMIMMKMLLIRWKSHPLLMMMVLL
uniref:Uncharacterized protein n=1 Tax=Arundo donax TaxID=35708 RepID=A0A0A9DBY0_ARUDO